MTGDTREPDTPPEPAEPPGLGVSAEAFREGFGEELRRILDLDTWQTGRDLSEEYRRIETEVRVAVECESAYQKRLRREVLPQIAEAPGAPRGAGQYRCE